MSNEGVEQFKVGDTVIRTGNDTNNYFAPRMIGIVHKINGSSIDVQLPSGYISLSNNPCFLKLYNQKIISEPVKQEKKQMESKSINRVIAELIPQTKAAVLIDRWFGSKIPADTEADFWLSIMLYKDKVPDLHAAAQMLQTAYDAKK